VRRSLRLLAPLALLVLAGSGSSSTDDLDAFILKQMAQRQVAGLSIAIIDGGRIVDTRAYGYTDSIGGRRVDTTTLLQAGSISKSVAALGALRLVEQGKLDLDADVNGTLRTWKLPSSRFTAAKSVTLRELLSHTAGLTVHGFPGYATTDQVPTLVQVLDGTQPANTPAIRNDTFPGARWNYSGGGYTIMQQMVLDVTGTPFPEFMRANVLAPLRMMRSSYEQPLPRPIAVGTAAGHYQDGSVVVGRSHVYPEMAAAGLWTTPSDLARFAIEVQKAYAGQSATVISPAMAKRMLTVERDGDGLGVFLNDTGSALRFNHNGRDEGFDAELTATAASGQGVVIMINANDDSPMVARIRDFVARKYRWPNSHPFVPPVPDPKSHEWLAALQGRYEMANNAMGSLMVRDGHLFSMSGGRPNEEFVFTDKDHIASVDRNQRFGVVRDASGAVVALTRPQGATTHTMPRIGTLFADIPAQRSTDVALDRQLEGVIRAMGAGGTAWASATGVTAGVRRDFGTNGWRPAQNMVSLEFVGASDVRGRNIERHDSPVAQVRYYRMVTPRGTAMLLVHLTAEGLVADVDTVDE
jgi:CubicO group peptidase (beta-lactamase class C family)